MDVKGTAIKTTRDFVRANFPDSYDAWINSLPGKSKEIYSSSMLNVARWYPLKETYWVPMEKIVELFYSGDEKAAGEALGRFSANLALTGIYKLFLLIATPRSLMTRATVVFSTYYIPSEVRVSESSSKSVSMQILKFPEMSPVLEYRIAGWCIRALELCGCKDIEYQISKSLVRGDSYTEMLYNWE